MTFDVVIPLGGFPYPVYVKFVGQGHRSNFKLTRKMLIFN